MGLTPKGRTELNNIINPYDLETADLVFNTTSWHVVEVTGIKDVAPSKKSVEFIVTINPESWPNILKPCMRIPSVKASEEFTLYDDGWRAGE